MSQTCPEKQSLREFLNGDMAQAESDTMLGHVNTCSDCDQVILELENEQNPVLAKIREGIRNERFLTEPEFNQLRVKAERLRGEKVEAPEGESASKKRIRDYRLIKKIGEGGMGIVYQAFQFTCASTSLSKYCLRTGLVRKSP